MKKILILAAALITLSASAQKVTPRTGTGANNDNTFRAMTINYKAVTDAVGNDTAKINLNAYKTLIKVASLVDSVSFNFTPVTNCYYGDEVVITIVNTSGSAHAVKWAGPNIESATTTTGGAVGTMYLTSAKRAVVSFIFNGVDWVEQYRTIQ